jgi:hypothetical protein
VQAARAVPPTKQATATAAPATALRAGPAGPRLT